MRHIDPFLSSSLFFFVHVRVLLYAKPSLLPSFTTYNKTVVQT